MEILGRICHFLSYLWLGGEKNLVHFLYIFGHLNRFLVLVFELLFSFYLILLDKIFKTNFPHVKQ